jgi:glucose-fructose oxidoreductase
MPSNSKTKTKKGKSVERAARQKVRYAVVGLGYIAQSAVLPAFQHSRNSKLVALVSDDATKLKKIAAKYDVSLRCSYDKFEDCLQSGEVDAVYIALPNSMHAEYAIRACQAKVHVLCEKPLAVTESECVQMIREANDAGVKLMTAYRLHFEEANLKAVETVQSGKLGDARVFNSLFTMQVKEGDIRLQRELGGGTLYDIGIYCINAARYLFRAEPTEVRAVSENNGESRFGEVEEMISAIMRFPEERLAAFTCSFGGSDVSAYQVVGTRGDLRVDPAYEYAVDLKHYLTINGKTRERKFAKRDQFAPELTYFSDCVLNGTEPEPSGWEGLADVRIIRALYQSAETGEPVALPPFDRDVRPSLDQEIHEPPAREPELVRAASPSKE